jgi:pimeloyl-ACP methyl ester carboxylesterase
MAFRRRKKEGVAQILGYKASYLHFAAKNPPATLVCFHGWLDNAASFVPLAEALPEYEIFAYDFLGHGKSAHKHRGERYHYIDLVPFIDAALRHVNRPEVVLVGHSMGAGASALYAGAIGERLKALITIEGLAPMTAEPAEAADILATGVREFDKAQNLPKPVYASLDEALKIRMRVNGLSREAALPLVSRAVKKVAQGITWRADFRLRAPSLMRMSLPHVKGLLSGIKVPALLVLGEQGMAELTRIAEADADIGKIFRVVRLPGHHHLHMDHAGQVAAAIRGFLVQVQDGIAQDSHRQQEIACK